MARATSALTAPCAAISAAVDAEHLGLGVVRIGDEAALEPVARAGERGAGGGDQAAGARLGRRHASAARRAARRASALDLRRRRRRCSQRTSTARSPAGCTGRRRSRRSRMPKPCAQPMRRDRARSLNAGRPRPPGRAWRRRRSGTARTRRPGAQKPAGVTQPEHEPEGDDLVPDDRAADRRCARWRAVTVQAHQPRSVAAPSTAAPIAAPSASGEHDEGEPGPQRARRCPARPATGRCRSRARSACAGWESRKRQSGLRPAPRSGGLSAGSVLTRPAPARLARKWSNEREGSIDGAAPRRRRGAGRLPRSMRPMRVTGDAGRARRLRRRRRAPAAAR